MADNQATQALLTEEDEDGLGFGEEGPEAKNKLKHPVIAFFHVFFRGAALVVYLFCGIFGTGFVPSFVTVIILLSLDFWTVKNITGRIMVGHRWWNYVDDDGVSHWVFESRKGSRAGGRAPERKVFWTALIVAPCIWMLFLLSTLFTFRFQWTILVVLALVLHLANLYGYVRCRLGHKPGMTDAAGILNQGFSSVIQRAASAAASATTSQNASNAFTTQKV